MTRLTVHDYAADLRPRYRAVSRRDKKTILNEFCQTTGLHRKAAIRLLNQAAGPKAVPRGRPRRYGVEVVEPLARVWEMGDRMCGKLLAAVMPDLLVALQRHGELHLPKETKDLLSEHECLNNRPPVEEAARAAERPTAQASSISHAGS